MDIVIDGLKPAEISGDAAALLVDEILCQQKHCRCPVDFFFGIGKRQMVSGHWPEISGMGAAAGRDDQAQQGTQSPLHSYVGRNHPVLIFNLGVHCIIRQEIIYSGNDAVHGSCQGAEGEFLLPERAMRALVKIQPCPILFAVIEIEKGKILLVKNQFKAQVDFC